jgi:hypothetical protein
MNHNDQLDQRISRALKRLNKTRKATLYLELLFRLAIYKLRVSRPRAHTHWIGGPRPRRPERTFITVVLLGSILTLETGQFILWSMAWGTVASFYVILQSLLLFIPDSNN